MAKRNAEGEAENPKTKQQVEHKEGTLRALFDATPLVSMHTLRNKVVTIDVTEKPLDAFRKIIESKVLSAPVWDSKAGKFIGFLDVRDLVSYVVMSYDYRAKQKQASDNKSTAKHSKKASLGKDGDWKFSKEAQEFLESVLVESWSGPTVRPGNPMDTLTVKYLCGRNRFVPVESKATLTDIARVLSNKDVHRVPVADNDNKLLDIISQSTIVEFIQKNASKLQDQLGQTIDKLGLARKEVVTVKAKEPTINAFRVLNSKNLYGLAVVDEEGKVIANTSSSDMKLFVAAPSFELLEMPLLEYLNIIRRASLKDVAPVVCVTAHDTLGRCVGKLAATKMHRIFVVDDHHKPIGVVSLRDIINACLHL